MADVQRLITTEDIQRRYNLQNLESNTKIIKTLDKQLTNTFGIIKEYIKYTTSLGSKEQYFLSGTPTFENEPEKNWDTKVEHLNTLYYDNDSGKVYVFVYENEEFKWKEITDTNAINIMSIANSQIDTSDGIRRVYYEQPTVPYGVGDIWVSGTKIYRCKFAEQIGGQFKQEDWIDYTQYDDNIASANGLRILGSFKETVETEYVTKSFLDQKDYAINGRVDTIENVAKSKSRVFTEEPTPPYYRGDSYIKEVTDSETGITMNLIYVCQYTRTEGTYHAEDFSLQPSYATTSQFSITADQASFAVAKIGTDPTVEGTILTNISSLTTRMGAVEAQVSEVADITKSAESNYALISDSDLTNIAVSEPIRIEIRPIEENISYLYPNSGLFPSNNLFLKVRLLKITNTQTNDIFMYEIPDDLLYYNEEYYDEFILDYANNICEVIKRCKYKSDGTVELLENERVDTYTYPTIELTEGNYKFEILGYNKGYIKVRLMAVNAYTDQYATKIELNGSISAEANRIDAYVDRQVETIDGQIEDINGELELKIGRNENNQIVSMLNVSTDEINLAGGSKINLTTAGKLLITAGNFKLDANGNITASGGKIAKWNITDDGLSCNYNQYEYTMSDFNRAYDIYLRRIEGTPQDLIKYDLNNSGNISLLDCTKILQMVNGSLDNPIVGTTTTNYDYNGITFNNTGTMANRNYNFKNEIGYDRIIISENNYYGENTSYKTSILPYNISTHSINSNYIYLNQNNTNYAYIDTTGAKLPNTNFNGSIYLNQNSIVGVDNITMSGTSAQINGADTITCGTLTANDVYGRIHDTSLAEKKKNIKPLKKKALDIINKTDIYTYNFKDDKNKNDYIGFVIGDKYNYANELVGYDNEGKPIGANTYSMASVSFKAIQELKGIIDNQQEEIEELKKEIQKMKESDK